MLVNRLRTILKQKGLKQATLAEMTGISQAQVSRIIGGQRKVSSNTMIDIARSLDIPVERIFFVADMPNGLKGKE